MTSCLFTVTLISLLLLASTVRNLIMICNTMCDLVSVRTNFKVQFLNFHSSVQNAIVQFSSTVVGHGIGGLHLVLY